MSHRSGKSSGIGVPGGVVVIDFRRGRGWITTGLGLVGVAIASGWGSIDRAKRDLVIVDPSKTRELYRIGPYDRFTVNRALKNMLEQIDQLGLDAFIRHRGIEASQVGPISEPSGKVGWGESLTASWKLAKDSWKRQ